MILAVVFAIQAIEKKPEGKSVLLYQLSYKATHLELV